MADRKIKNVDKIFAIHPDCSGFSKLILEIAFADCEKTSKQNLRTEFFSIRKFDLYVIWAFLQILTAYLFHILTSFRGKPFYLFTLGKVEMGKSINAAVLRDCQGCHLSKARYFIKFHIFLGYSVFVLASAQRIQKEINGVWLDNVFYLNGILADYFLNSSQTIVYLDLGARNKVRVTGRAENVSAVIRNMDSWSSDSFAERTFDVCQVEDYMIKRLADPASSIPYYNQSTVRGSQSKLGNQSLRIVVYLHSFADAQMVRGFDGFKNSHDWLKFTLNELERLSLAGNTLLKVHPNFLIKNTAWTAPEFDLAIWNKFKNQIPSSFKIIDEAVDNARFLEDFDPANTILISHHGNPIIEGSYLGFRSISSTASPWRNHFRFSTTWSNRNEYSRTLGMLSDISNLEMPSRHEIMSFISSYYMSIESFDFEDALHRGLSDMKPSRESQGQPSDFRLSRAEVLEEMVRKFNHASVSEKKQITKRLMGKFRTIPGAPI